MKKILSVFAAAALLFGFASCSGDLHDMNDAPIVERPTVIVGAMNYDGGNVFSEMVKVDELTSSYTFIYKSSMSANWGSPADGVAFKVGYEADDWDHCWSQETAGTTALSDGRGEIVCKAQNAQNIAFGGLADGKTYKITATAGIASVSVKIEQAADIPSYTLNANGMLYSMDYSADGEKGLYKVTLKPASDDLELTFFDGTDNYGSSATAVDVSGTDTDKSGNAQASKSAVVVKLSDTVTGGAKFTGLQKNEAGEFYDYIVTLTVDGDAKTVAITRVIPKHNVTFKFNVTGGDIVEGDTVFIHGWSNLEVYGFDWPLTNGNFDNTKKTWSGTVDANGKATIKGTIELVDEKTYSSEECFCVGIVGTDGKFKWQTKNCKLIEYKTSNKDMTLYINVVLTKAPTEEKGTAVVSKGTAPTVKLRNIIVNADLTSYTLIGEFNSWGGDVEGVVADGKTTFDVSSYISDNFGEFKFRKDKGWNTSIGPVIGGIELPDSEKAGKADVIIDVDMTARTVTNIKYSYID